MVEFHVGRHGVLLLVLVFLLLGAEDLLIWVNAGTVPAVEFFAAMLIVLAVVAVAIHEANLNPPHRR